MKIGGPKSLTDEVQRAGGQIGPRARWLGGWNLSSGIGDWDTFFSGCKADGVQPLVIAWLFGDDISPSALTSGVKDRYNGNFKTSANLTALLNSVMAKAKAAGVSPLVACEPEFSKNGAESSTAFGPYFDGLVAATHTCPGAKAMFAPGVWSDHGALASFFAKQISGADCVGLQSVKFAPRHGTTGIQNAAAELSHAFSSYPGKQHVIYDLALSTYGGSYSTTPPFAGGDGAALESLQAGALASIGTAAAGMGVDTIVYRDLKDNPQMSTANYGGIAEQFVGVQRADGTRKAGFATLMALSTSSVPPGPTPTPQPASDLQAQVDKLQADLTACRAAYLKLKADMRTLLDATVG